MSAALGIDFGTSKCCAYLVRDGELQLVKADSGDETVPSWVAFTDTEVLVGERAKRQAANNPTHTVFGIKRLLGRKFFGPETSWLRDAMAVGLVPAPNGDAWFHIGGLARSPQELVSYVLEDVRRRAAVVAGGPISKAVLTVPTFFDERQRRAMLEAAKLAGLNVERLLHAPTAATIAHRFIHPSRRGRWAILDMGGGSLDVAVVDVSDERLEVLSAKGDPLLGGDDFDRRIAEHLVERFYTKHQIDLGEDPAAIHRLFAVGRNAKHEMALATRSSPLRAANIAESIHLDEPGLARGAFDELIHEELDRIAVPCAIALEDIGFGTDDMDEVLLLGGLAHMPSVLQTVEYLFRKAPTAPANGTLMPAMGAALYAASRLGERPPILLDELTPHSTGIKIRDGLFSPVIHRRALVPCREQKVFAAARQGQRSVVFEVYQGDSEVAKDNAYLGRFGMKPAGDRVAVAFNLDESGVLSISLGAGKNEKRVTLQASCGIADDELERLLDARGERSRILPDPELTFAVSTASTLPPPDSEEQSGPPSLRPQRSLAPAASPQPLPQRSIPPPSRTPHSGSAPIEVADDSLVGTTVGDRYIIDDIIADGGMGRVYLARHAVLDKKLALKVLHAELAQNEELAARFVREAQAAARIDSPHVIDIVDFGRLPDGTGYFVMEYLAGVTLAQLIADRGALPSKLIVDVAMQLTTGLTVAHDLGIVHRDLKPENVTLIQRGGHPYFCKIVDFGIAKAPTSDSQKHETLAGTLLGTPYYMAPEQIDGAEIDGRCDIYSLGAVMYEMATGVPPFDSDTLVGVLVKHKTETPQPVRSHEAAAQCPIELQAVIHRCLAKSPADRFQSARELKAALAAL